MGYGLWVGVSKDLVSKTLHIPVSTRAFRFTINSPDLLLGFNRFPRERKRYKRLREFIEIFGYSDFSRPMSAAASNLILLLWDSRDWHRIKRSYPR